MDSLEEFERELKENLKDCRWSLSLKCLWRNLWILRRVLVAFVTTLWSFSDDFEVIVIVNKTSLLVELDDCYCCAS